MPMSKSTGCGSKSSGDRIEFCLTAVISRGFNDPGAGFAAFTVGYGGTMETLRVGLAFPDPPFNGMPDDGGQPAGLDIDLMSAIAESLGAAIEFVTYDGTDFNGIFDALDNG